MTATPKNEFFKEGAMVSCAPGKILLGWGECRSSAEPAMDAPFSLFRGDYFLSDPQPWLTYEFCREFSVQELILWLEGSEKSQVSPIDWVNPEKALFAEAISDLKRRFSEGELQKGVPYLFETAKAPVTKQRLRKSLLNLLRCSLLHPIYLYGFWGQEHGILGGTPELLFRIARDMKKPVVFTEACAGTCTNSEGGVMVQDPKQQHEHDLVVDGIVKSFHPFGKVRKGKMTVLEVGMLCHLVTPIEVELAGTADFQEVLEALHPTPALGGYPQKMGMEWAKNYQNKVDRGLHGAPVGFYRAETQESVCYVAIRNAQWSQNEIKIGAGCGIVQQSRLEDEWDEMLLKIQSTKELLSL